MRRSLGATAILLGCLSAAGPLRGQAPPGGTGTKKAMVDVITVGGLPALRISAGQSEAYLVLESNGDPDIDLATVYEHSADPVTRGTYQGDPAFQFLLSAFVVSSRGRIRLLNVTQQHLTLSTLKGKNTGRLVRKHLGSLSLSLKTWRYHWGLALETHQTWMNRLFYVAVIPSIDASQFDGCGWATVFKDYKVNENVNVDDNFAVCKAVIGWLRGALTDFSGTEQKYDVLVQGDEAFKNAVAAGDGAIASGHHREAFEDYMRANATLRPDAGFTRQYLTLPLWKKIASDVIQLNPPPAIPQEAVQHSIYAQAAAESARGPSDLVNAEHEWWTAIKYAPWWADAYFNLAAIATKANDPQTALTALHMYLIANPNAANAHDVQLEIYKLQYEAAHAPNSGRN